MKKIISTLTVLFLLAVFLLDVPAQTNGRHFRTQYPSHNGKRHYRTYSPIARNAVTRGSAAMPSPSPVSEQPAINNDKTPLPPSPVVSDEKNFSNVEMPKAAAQEIDGDVQSGNVVVNINSNGNAVVKIGLANRAVSVVDFPANDPVYRIHPGDENFVTVGCNERDDNGKCGNSPSDAIILRPGKNFHALDTEESAATVITIQRVSGIVVTLIVVPVKTVSQNANYVVVRYNLKDVIEARMKAGLAVNLRPGAPAMNPNGQPPSTADPADNSKGEPDFVQAKSDGGVANPPNQTDDLETQVLAEMRRAAAQNGGNLRFSKPVYGISLAKVASTSTTGEVVIQVVAVRNTLSQPLRLVPEQPKLVVENREKRNESINIQSVAWLQMVTTADENDVLNPGEVYYYAFAYASPILDVKQVLRVIFAQRDAADAPASMDLGGLAR